MIRGEWDPSRDSYGKNGEMLSPAIVLTLANAFGQDVLAVLVDSVLVVTWGSSNSSITVLMPNLPDGLWWTFIGHLMVGGPRRDHRQGLVNGFCHMIFGDPTEGRPARDG